MNRDELRDRAPESPPRLRQAEGLLWMAPGDAGGAGTWMGANCFGVVACLLNRYPDDGAGPPAKSARSRGEIIPELLAQGPMERCLDWLLNFRPALHGPFTLLVSSLSESLAVGWEGSGRLLRLPALAPGWDLLTSSSWNQKEVIDWRRRAFQDWLSSGAAFAGEIPAFNLLHEPGKEWWSPLVRRQLSETRSITQVEADGSRGFLEMRYWPQPWEEPGTAASRLRIPMREAGRHSNGAAVTG